MSEETTLENVGIPAGVITSEEEDNLRRERIQTEVASLLREEREQDTERLVEVVREMRNPNQERPALRIPSTYEKTAVHHGRIATRSPTDPMYRRLPEDEREWRNPESDHWMASWIRANFNGEESAAKLARAKLEEMFPARATVTEGTAGASGAVSTGTGGEFIPRPLEAVVMINRDRVAKMRRFATIYQMTRQQHNIPTQAAMTAAMVGESTTAAQGEGAVAQVPLIAMKGQVVAYATREILDDAAVNLVNVFAARAGGALGVLEDDQCFKDGDGTAPNITKLSGTTFTETTSGTISFTNMLNMYRGVVQQYRDRGVWFISDDVLTLLSNVRDGQGRPLYDGLLNAPGAIGDDRGQVGQILRRAVYEVPFTNGEIWFGDPAAAYAFGNRQGIQVEVSRDVRFLYDEIVWKFTQRFAGNNVDLTNSTRYCTGITIANSL